MAVQVRALGPSSIKLKFLPGIQGPPGDITPEFLALAAQIGQDAATASGAAGTAMTQAGLATTRAGEAATSAGAAQTAREGAEDARDEAEVILGQIQAGVVPDNTVSMQKLDPSLRNTIKARWTVENYGAVGDGITDDRGAFLAMAADTGGTIRMLNKVYNLGATALELSGYANLLIEGAKRPSPNTAITQLEGGTVLVGFVNIRGNNVVLRNFGVDVGSARGSTFVNGLYCDAVEGQRGRYFSGENLAFLGHDIVSPSHGFLVEGYDSGRLHNIYAGRFYYAIVSKNRNFDISGIDGDLCGTNLLYVKSDTPDMAGNVADATVQRVNVRGVNYRADVADTTSCAVHVYASTAAMSDVAVDGVHQVNGQSALLAFGSSTTNLIERLSYSNISSVNAQTGIQVIGNQKNSNGTNISARNPKTGRIAWIWGDDWNVTNLNLVVDDAAITSSIAALFDGTGAWDNFTVKNAARAMLIHTPATWGVIRHGQKRGNIRVGLGSGGSVVDLEAGLSLKNGATAGAPTPRMVIGPNNRIHLKGRVMVGSLTNQAFANLPFTVSQEMLQPVAVWNTSAGYVIRTLDIANTELWLPGDRTNVSYIDLDGISFEI